MFDDDDDDDANIRSKNQLPVGNWFTGLLVYRLTTLPDAVWYAQSCQVDQIPKHDTSHGQTWTLFAAIC